MKTNFMKSYLNYFLIIFQNLLCFAEIDPNQNSKKNDFVIMKYKYALRYVEAHFDRSDPRVLNVVVKENSNFLDLSVYFDDMGKTSNIKQSIDENRKSARNTEYLLLDSYFDELINKMKF
jgi:hypothetical protein